MPAGAILTKMDGDSRGGAALSVKAVSGKPIKFVGTGEKLEALEPFYPDRIASRILGDFSPLSQLFRSHVHAADAFRVISDMPLRALIHSLRLPPALAMHASRP